MTRKILVIEDNQDLAKLLELHLKDLSFDVALAFDGPTGFKMANDQTYDLVILDLMLPGMDGMEICRRVRDRQSYTPILILTSKSTELDRVLGLEMGADDYVTKPFSIRELMARVKAIFRRVDEINRKDSSENPDVIRIGGFAIDSQSRTARLNEEVLNLTAREFDLLFYFACHPGRVYTRAQLLDEVWGYGHDGYEHTVNSHINRLRGKIEINPAQPEYIRTVWGVGYKFEPPDHPEGRENQNI